jgi:hypothetical protein
LFQIGPAVRIIGTAETNALARSLVDVHGFAATGAGRPFGYVRMAGALEAELPMANLA